ncbi:beta-galactosidase [Rathayibacter sp. PhB127]|uniref:beta-galactosidase n=1 Tax=Rathayibacter sp. PhB127 TaxID=2485176 RepID=UPI000F4B9CC0|nr:beta-galactosidase [Rathayibacter sp. PhB127]ROS21560.1 beta-galactosidase [Rathayibacter sp. PhB127]
MTTTAPTTPRRWPTAGLSFGGDYNPEQWPREIWQEDVRLMVEAGVNIVTLGVFSWGTVEAEEGHYDWSATDEVIELLWRHGIAVDLATPTAAPPAWLHEAHPEILPVNADLVPQFPGARLGWCPSSRVFHEKSLRVVAELATRYAHHPAVVLWHVSNELGGGNGRCYCDESAAAFRGWLRAKYVDVEVLNSAWGTGFWGHRYASFEQVRPPRGREAQNPAAMLDFDRFSSDELLGQYRAEKAVILSVDPDASVTTNFMVGPSQDVVDYPRWAAEVDVVANDHYTLPTDPDSAQDIAFSGDRMRGMTAGRRPWLLMEHSTSAGTWHPVNRAKAPRELIRNSLGHIARGSDGALFFQWRSSRSGAEQYFSGMVPHAGTDSKIWRETKELGGILQRLAGVAGSRVEEARVAILFDDEAGWALTRGLKPRHGLAYGREARAWHLAFWRRNVLVDVVGPWADLSGYDIVVVPTLLLVDDASAAAIAAVVERGGTIVVTYLSGVVDENDRIRTGGFPGAFRELLGTSSEEHFPLLEGERVLLDDGSTAVEWIELMRESDRVEVVSRYATGALAGHPAVTRSTAGPGSAWYVSAMLEREGVGSIVDRITADAGLSGLGVPDGIEAVRRVGDAGGFLFLTNHTAQPVTVAANGLELVTGSPVDGSLDVPAGEVRVVQETP